MKHAEYLYLLGRAEMTRSAAQKARLDGEDFHPVMPYAVLASGLQAVAWFSRESLHLKIRHDAEVSRAQEVGEVFRLFFDKPFSPVAQIDLGRWTVYEAHGPEPTSPTKAA